MKLTVEVRSPEDVMEEGHTVHLFADEEGLEMLIASLKAMRDDLPRSNQLTLFSEEWGNGELSTDKVVGDAQITHCLKITKHDW